MQLGINNNTPAFGIRVKGPAYKDKALWKALESSKLIKEIDAKYPKAVVEFCDYRSMQLLNKLRYVDAELKFNLDDKTKFSIVGVGTRKNGIEEIIDKMAQTTLASIRRAEIVKNYKSKGSSSL